MRIRKFPRGSPRRWQQPVRLNPKCLSQHRRGGGGGVGRYIFDIAGPPRSAATCLTGLRRLPPSSAESTSSIPSPSKPLPFRRRLGSPPPVPEGRPLIARRFNTGCAPQRPPCPGGTPAPHHRRSRNAYLIPPPAPETATSCSPPSNALSHRIAPDAAAPLLHPGMPPAFRRLRSS